MRLRIPTASTYQRQLTSSPRSVWIRHRAASSSHSARVTPVWNSASVDQVEPLGDRLEVAADLLAEGVAPGGDVVELLEHRACRCTTRRRTSRPGSGSSTRCPRCRRPGRRCGSARRRPCGGWRRPGTPAMPPPTMTTSTSSATGSRSVTRREGVVAVLGEVLVVSAGRGCRRGRRPAACRARRGTWRGRPRGRSSRRRRRLSPIPVPEMRAQLDRTQARLNASRCIRGRCQRRPLI